MYMKYLFKYMYRTCVLLCIIIIIIIIIYIFYTNKQLWYIIFYINFTFVGYNKKL